MERILGQTPRRLKQKQVINAKQSESIAKVNSPDREVGRLQKEGCTGRPQTSSFYR
jgi:hypothetical protein